MLFRSPEREGPIDKSMANHHLCTEVEYNATPDETGSNENKQLKQSANRNACLRTQDKISIPCCTYSCFDLQHILRIETHLVYIQHLNYTICPAQKGLLDVTTAVASSVYTFHELLGLSQFGVVTYRIAAKYSNKTVFQHWFKEGCRIVS